MVESWLALLAEGRHVDLAAALTEQHYDPAYARARARHPGTVAERVTAETLDERGLTDTADRLAAAIERLNR